MTGLRTSNAMVRALGAALVAYGAVGLILVAIGGSLATGSLGNVDQIGAIIDSQRQALVRSLDASATFLADARRGSANVQTSLSSTVTSARQSADVGRSLASAMDQLAAASAVSILGNQPFGGLTAPLADVARHAGALADSLDATAGSLQQNSADLASISTDLSSIEGEVARLRSELSASDGLASTTVASAARAVDGSRAVLIGLLVWLAMQAILAAIAGVVLWRAAAPARVSRRKTASERSPAGTQSR